MAIEDLRNRDWVLLPGTLCTAEVFTGFLDALEIPETRRPPLTLRHPAVEDYAETLVKRAPGAVLCGFSLGAIVAAHLADRCDATRIILFGLNPFADDPAKAPGRLHLSRDVAVGGGTGALMPGLPPLGGSSPETARGDPCHGGCRRGRYRGADGTGAQPSRRA
jgi:pimeloyl-ACP methyl ester carboxylesterase